MSQIKKRGARKHKRNKEKHWLFFPSEIRSYCLSTSFRDLHLDISPFYLFRESYLAMKEIILMKCFIAHFSFVPWLEGQVKFSDPKLFSSFLKPFQLSVCLYSLQFFHDKKWAQSIIQISCTLLWRELLQRGRQPSSTYFRSFNLHPDI